jgi:hypothetical protein
MNTLLEAQNGLYTLVTKGVDVWIIGSLILYIFALNESENALAVLIRTDE